MSDVTFRLDVADKRWVEARIDRSTFGFESLRTRHQEPRESGVFDVPSDAIDARLTLIPKIIVVTIAIGLSFLDILCVVWGMFYNQILA